MASAAGGAAAAAGQGDLIVQGDGVGDRVHPGADAVLAGGELKVEHVQVGEQGVGLHQERGVGVVAVVVEMRLAVGQPEVGIVQHQVALDLTDAVGAQVAQQLPEALLGELGVTGADQKQVALEHVAVQFPVGVNAGVPFEAGAEQLQRRVGGQQLHGGARVHHPVRVDEARLARAVQGHGGEGQGFIRQLQRFHALHDPVRPVFGAGGGGQEGGGDNNRQNTNGKPHKSGTLPV